TSERGGRRNLGLQRHGAPLRVLPVELDDRAASRHGDVLRLIPDGELDVTAAADRVGADPVAIQPFAVVGADDQRRLTVSSTARLVGELRSNLVARRGRLPTLG